MRTYTHKCRACGSGSFSAQCRDAFCADVADPVPVSVKTDPLEWLWANCRITYYPPDGSYPIEHTMAAQKDCRELIEAARDKWSNADFRQPETKD